MNWERYIIFNIMYKENSIDTCSYKISSTYHSMSFMSDLADFVIICFFYFDVYFLLKTISRFQFTSNKPYKYIT